ncbi:hypothetical protein NKR23_g2935 [Pleurostoma richardsiae]|uniref:Uncharacterized protein n=1 Tax=Pleurostoma richardsiae TaxID=41990 RepID=A0AA38VXT8_9PEZI|nr:hypothetical protein NKR23_g2935 [Pleurostoma richardsiae]
MGIISSKLVGAGPAAAPNTIRLSATPAVDDNFASLLSPQVTTYLLLVLTAVLAILLLTLIIVGLIALVGVVWGLHRDLRMLETTVHRELDVNAQIRREIHGDF